MAGMSIINLQRSEGAMKRKILEDIRKSWKIQTFQFDYLSHVKQSVLYMHLFSFVLCFGIGVKVVYALLGCIPCMLSFDFFVLFDKKRRAYFDSYVPQRYEWIGTIYATVVVSIVILGIVWGYQQAKNTI